MILLIPILFLLFHFYNKYLNSIIILLIQRLSVSMVLCICYLNSIMILLILITEMSGKASATAFKFHYDSINSRSEILLCKFDISYLNSIMILLIRQQVQPRLTELVHLNSIMILLIPKENRLRIYQYLHLNSIMILLILIWRFHISKRSLFKFHYDSINSITSQAGAVQQLYLNSIMILLIPVPKSSPYLSQKTSLFCRPLQNSTFLSCP